MPEVQPLGVLMTAEELNGQWIGRVVEFPWRFPNSLVNARVWGELREIQHDGGDKVVVWLTGAGSDATTGDKAEFVIPRGTIISSLGA